MDAAREDSEESVTAEESARRAALPSPGVGLRHYAPRARLILVEGERRELPALLAAAAAHWLNQRLGVLLPADMREATIPDAAVFDWGRWTAPEEMARTLYAGLRALDAAGCTVILAPLPPAEGIGSAIRDRMGKAAHREPASAIRS
jgi:L-threonylcarbamoyladenylate synthase